MTDHQTSEIREIVAKVAALCRETLDGSTTAIEFVDQIGNYHHRALNVLQGFEKHHFVESKASLEWTTYAASTKVVEWCNASGVTLDKRTYWWPLSEERTGHIGGVPNSQGIARITDGVMLWVERHNQSPLLGHLAEWRKDPRPTTAKGLSIGRQVKDIINGGGDKVEMHRRLLEALLGEVH
jgi:hypothetical protein